MAIDRGTVNGEIKIREQATTILFTLDPGTVGHVRIVHAEVKTLEGEILSVRPNPNDAVLSLPQLFRRFPDAVAIARRITEICDILAEEKLQEAQLPQLQPEPMPEPQG